MKELLFNRLAQIVNYNFILLNFWINFTFLTKGHFISYGLCFRIYFVIFLGFINLFLDKNVKKNLIFGHLNYFRLYFKHLQLFFIMDYFIRTLSKGLGNAFMWICIRYLTEVHYLINSTFWGIQFVFN
jgi:hypothetical protein